MKFTSVYQSTIKKRGVSGKIILGLLVALSLVAVILIGSQNLGQKDTASEESRASEGELISFMSYNIMWSHQTDERLDKIADCIMEEGIDIVGIQEVNGFYGRDSGDRNTIEDLKLILANKGKSFYSTPVVRRTIGILSKYQVSDYFSDTFTTGEEHRGYQTGIINFVDRVFRVVNVHPTSIPLCEQNNELHGILNDPMYSLYDGTFVMGDFNMPFGDPNYPCNNLFRENWFQGCDPYINDLCLDSVNDEVWHRYGGSGEASYIIDNVIFNNNNNWIVKEAYVSTSDKCSTSDHFPVVVRFEYQEETLCTPLCTGKECGDDGCGGSCGTCTEEKVCNENGQCVVQQGLPSVSVTPRVRKADYTGTGRVGMADFLEFKICYVERDPCSDLNEDGNYDQDIQDWLVFIREYKEDNIEHAT